MQWPWNKAESDLERELRHHLAALAEANERQGMPPADAMRAAKAEFGGLEQAKEQCRDIRWWSPLTQLGRDLRFGWRMMRRTPAITLAAAVSLALGIGATTSMLSLADVLLWRTLAVPAPERLNEVLWESRAEPEGLVEASSGSVHGDGAWQVSDFFSYASYDAMRDRTAGQVQIAAHLFATSVSASFRGAVVVGDLRAVSGNFFRVLALDPFAGRLLAGADDDPGAAPVIVVTHRFWSRQLGGEAEAVGQTVRINNGAYTLAGVLPPSFGGIVPGDRTDIYVPIHTSPSYVGDDSWIRSQHDNPRTWWLQLLVRREPGVSVSEARAALDAAFRASWPAEPKSAEVTPAIRLSDASHGLGSVRREFGEPLWILLGLVTMVLLVVCANIANLLLARSVSREHEVALRVSLGCGRRRLIRQFLTESLMLAALGGLLSIPVVALVSDLLVSLLGNARDGMALSLEPDARSLAVTMILVSMAAVLFGLYPARRAARVDPGPALKEGGGAAGTASRHRWAPAKALVVMQVSLGVLLVSAAILFTTHLDEIVSRDTGFERGHVLLFDVRPGEVGIEGDRLRQYYAAFERRLSELNGVSAVGIARTRPMLGGGRWGRVGTPGGSEAVSTALHYGSAEFLDALGVPLVAGRSFSAQDVAEGRKVAIISASLAQQLNADSPLGMAVTVGEEEHQVIGVAQDARYSRMTQSPAVTYLPFDPSRHAATVVLPTSIAPLAVFPRVREVLREIAPDVPIVDVFSMDQQISRTLQRERLFAWLCGSFGVLALVLCVVGLYGLMAHTTARRTAEMGIRIALGASRREVVGQVLGEAMGLAGVGLLLGVPLAIYVAQVSPLQGLMPEGPMPYGTLAAAVGVLAFSAFLAALAPAVRASNADPLRSLRRA